jgi:uncharacterized protein (DUF885 family)
MSEFERLTKEILDHWWRTSPVQATSVGVHDYDSELDNYDRGFLLSLAQVSREQIARLNRLDASRLAPEEQTDLRLLRDALSSGIRAVEERRAWAKDPSGCIQIGLYGIFVMAIREFAPLEQRAGAMLSRLKQVPRLLEQGKANLEDSPEVFTRVAIEVAQGGIEFYQGFIPTIADQVPALKAELLEASRKAVEAVQGYCDFLENEHLARSKGSYAIGRELFDYMLRTDHGLPYNADDLLKIADDVLRNTEVELERLAKQIDPARNWWEILADLKREHPGPDELLGAYRQEMQRARDFTREHNLVAIPAGEELELIWTPPFERALIPYAAYMPPAPFEQAQKGFFYVTPVNPQLPPDKQEEQLGGHSRYKIPVTALHEAYPGHHLQLVHSNRVRSDLRRVLGTSVFAEGWALYCEELMYDLGFYEDPKVRLAQLRDQVWRACRVLIDVGLHTQGMTFDSAVETLVKRARLEPVNAETEVKRYCSTPTQPMSYVIGKHQIMALRKEYEARMGAQFNLREFHDRLLSHGTIPVAIVREAMLGGFSKSPMNTDRRGRSGIGFRYGRVGLPTLRSAD